jgi:hypothetical protein
LIDTPFQLPSGVRGRLMKPYSGNTRSRQGAPVIIDQYGTMWSMSSSQRFRFLSHSSSRFAA